MSAAERQERIIELLCQRRKDTIPNLAAEFGVSERTIRRDIEILTCRHPLETVCGRYGGGVRVEEGYYLDSRRMSVKQTDLLLRQAKCLQGEDKETILQIIAQFGALQRIGAASALLRK